MLNQRLLASVISFFMFVNTLLHATSQHHDITLTLIAVLCDSVCSNFAFLKTGLVKCICVLQTPILGNRVHRKIPLDVTKMLRYSTH